MLNWNCQSRHVHFHLLSSDREAVAVADLADGDGAFDEQVSAAGTTRGVSESTFSNRTRNSRTCALLIRKEGSRRIVKPCVQLISKPRLSASATNGPPSMESSTPNMQPWPRISLTKSN